MTSLRRRIAGGADGRPTLAATGVPVAEALRRLEAGEAPAAVFGPHALDLAAALAFTALGGEDSLGLPLVRKRPEHPGLIAAASETALAGLLPGAPRPVRLALAAGLLQILDAWDASHEAAQEGDDRGEHRFSPYWHGIAHRREPDPGNASYWFRRVGRHEMFAGLADDARDLFRDEDDRRIAARVVGSGAWDASAMIELASRARPGSREEAVARRLQRLEMARLLDATAEAAAGAPSDD